MAAPFSRHQEALVHELLEGKHDGASRHSKLLCQNTA